MSESKTPLTDKLMFEESCNFEVAWEDQCRKLELTTADLRGQLAKSERERQYYINATVALSKAKDDQLAKAVKERDEARKVAGILAAGGQAVIDEDEHAYEAIQKMGMDIDAHLSPATGKLSQALAEFAKIGK